MSPVDFNQNSKLIDKGLFQFIFFNCQKNFTEKIDSYWRQKGNYFLKKQYSEFER